MTHTHDLIGREYLRVSVDRNGKQKSHGQQHGENVDTFDTIMSWGEPYRDTGSASKHARRNRDDFDRLVADIEHDRFDADVLVLWEPSRGSRKTGEWCSLIDLCEAHGVKIAVTTDERIYDPENGSDVHTLHMKAADAQYESAKTSKRGRRDAAAAAAAGRPHGKVPFGYERRYELSGGKATAVEQFENPAEAALVRELFNRLAEGHSLKAIAKDWSARGITSRTGKTMVNATLRQMALNRSYVGQRVHRPSGSTVEHITEGTWPPLVDVDLFERVRHRLTDPRRKLSRPGRARHLLSYIAVCDVCGAPIAATYRGELREYVCSSGHTRLNADDLDARAELIMLAFLSDRELYGRLTASGDVAAVEELRSVIGSTRAQLDDLAAQLDGGAVDYDFAMRSATGLTVKLRDAERRLDELTTPDELRDLMPPGTRADVTDRWMRAPISTRREVARLLLGGGGKLGTLRITRAAANRQWVPVERRIVGIDDQYVTAAAA